MSVNKLNPVTGGIPSGNTASRPSSPTIGTTYYNGQKGFLEIYNGSAWVVASSVPGAPGVSVTDVGTSRSYGAAQATVAITAPTNGGPVSGYVVTASNATNSYTASTASAGNVTLNAGNGGAYNLSVYAYSEFGNSASTSTVPTLTTVPGTPSLSVGTTTTTSLSINVSVDNGGKSITNFSTSTDGVTYTALSPAQTSGPIVFSALSSGTSYTRYIKAINDNGTSAAASITATTAYDIDYLVVGGGGSGGGYYYSGGGGGAGAATGTITITPGTAYALTVGAGGAQVSASTDGVVGNPGTNSTFHTYIGYFGGGARDGVAATGAGGAAATSTTGGRGGGNGADSETGAGGGGSSANAGSPGTSTAGGNGGNGMSSSITGTATNYGGGGGGNGYNDPRGSGGTGGGGNGTRGGGTAVLGSAGTANTGGGGGGGSHPAQGASYGYGWAGGSGVVILKIPSAGTATFSNGTTTSLSTSVSGYKIYTVTAASASTVTFGQE